MTSEKGSEESVPPESTPEPTQVVQNVLKVTILTTEGLEFSTVFPEARPGRYRVRKNMNTDPSGKVVTRRFVEHELFWTEDY